MTSVSIQTLLTSVRATLAEATTITGGLGVAHKPDQMKENIVDTPTLQIYPVSGQTDPQGDTDRTTFGAGVRRTTIVLWCDYYARQRSHLGEDLDAVVDGMDAIINILEAQQVKPYFGNANIKAFAWGWEYVSFSYGEQEVKYSGVRFILTLTIF